MVVHEAAVGATVEWYTPPTLFTQLGIAFDMDPAAGVGDRVPARDKFYSGGLDVQWDGRIWLNPPYGPAAVPFIDRMIEHRDGILLVAARTETQWFQKAAQSAEIVCFLRDRLHFIRVDGYQARSSHASVLMGWGRDSQVAIRGADLGWTVPATKERPRLLCPYHDGYIDEHDKDGGCLGSAAKRALKIGKQASL